MRWIFLALGGLLILFIVLPLSVLFVEQASNWDALSQTIRDPFVLDALKNSLLTATATTIIALILGVPLGYVLARKDFPGKSLVQAVIDLPVVVPHTVVGIILLITFSKAILDNYLGIVAAMLFVSAPFTVNSARDGFSAIDEEIENVARTLGASELRTFLTISLPLALRSIASGAVMTWARAISEVGAILIVAYYPKTAPVLILDYFNSYGLSKAMPVAFLLLVVCLSVFLVLRWALCSKSLR